MSHSVYIRVIYDDQGVPSSGMPMALRDMRALVGDGPLCGTWKDISRHVTGLNIEFSADDLGGAHLHLRGEDGDVRTVRFTTLRPPGPRVVAQGYAHYLEEDTENRDLAVSRVLARLHGEAEIPAE